MFFRGLQDVETVNRDRNAVTGAEKDVNVELIGWIQKYLYPYSLDPAPFKPADVPVTGGLTIGQIIGQQPAKKRTDEKFDILTTKRFNFPLSHLDAKEEFLQDIIRPVRMQKEQIMKDMLDYTHEFPTKLIPHVTDRGQINDIIHCYKRPKEPSKEEGTKSPAHNSPFHHQAKP